MTAVVRRSRTDVEQSGRARPSLALRPGTAAPAPRPPRTAGDVMTRFPPSVGPGDSLWTAWDRLSATGSSHVVVVDALRRPVGVLDDRTIALEWPGSPAVARRTPVHELLRGRVRPRVRSSQDLAAVARVMVGAGVDALPVIDREGRLYGLVTLWHFAALAAAAQDGDGGREAAC